MKKKYLFIAITGELIILCVIGFIVAYMPMSLKIIDVDFKSVNAKLSEYDKYNLDPNDLAYLKALGKALSEGYQLNQNNLNLFRSLFKYFLIVILISAFQISYFSIVFFKGSAEP